MIDAWNIGHRLNSYFYFSDISIAEGFINCCQIFLNGILNVFKRLFLSFSL